MEKKRGPKPSANPLGTVLPGKVEPPAHLSTQAKRHWKEVVDLIDEAGLASRLDRDALTIYCTHWARWREAELVIAGDFEDDPARPKGEVIKASNGYLQPSPWYVVATNAMKDMRTFLDRFGLTPMARSKLKLTEPEDDGGGKWADVE